VTRRIAPGVYVHVAGVAYGPGDAPPAEHAARIKNPGVWEEGDAEPAPTQAPAQTESVELADQYSDGGRPAKKTAAKKAAPSKEV
jgi:hypothetical protein